MDHTTGMLQTLALFCAFSIAWSSHIPCENVLLSGAVNQLITGEYQYTADCGGGGRLAYSTIYGGYFLYYTDSHWIVHGELCIWGAVHDALAMVVDDAVYPEDVQDVWQELQDDGSYIPNPELTVMCYRDGTHEDGGSNLPRSAISVIVLLSVIGIFNFIYFVFYKKKKLCFKQSHTSARSVNYATERGTIAHAGNNPAHTGNNPAHTGNNPAHTGNNPTHTDDSGDPYIICNNVAVQPPSYEDALNDSTIFPTNCDPPSYSEATNDK